MTSHHDLIMRLVAFLLLGAAFMVGERSACECNPRPPDYCSYDAIIQAVVVDKKGPLLPRGFSPDVDLESYDAETMAFIELYWRDFGPYDYTLDIVDTYGWAPPLQYVPSVLNMPSGPALCGLELTNGTRYLLGVSNHGIWLSSDACKGLTRSRYSGCGRVDKQGEMAAQRQVNNRRESWCDYMYQPFCLLLEIVCLPEEMTTNVNECKGLE